MPDLSAIPWDLVRLVLGMVVVGMLGKWTYQRFVEDDMSDPSWWGGGDLVLLRLSGMAYIVVVLVLAAVLLEPFLSPGLYLILVAIGGIWAFSELREAMQ